MNDQTPGPVIPIPGDPYRDFSHILLSQAPNAGALGHSPKQSEAALGYTRYKPADAALLAASYTAFDKAGRELGVDAAELARSLDLAALIRAAKDTADAFETLLRIERVNPADNETLTHLRSHLPKLPA